MEQQIGFPDVLKAELKEILGAEHLMGLDLPACPLPPANETRAQAKERERAYEAGVLEKVDAGTDLAALCVSGGGIRSATFALGVVQGFARFGLLNQFHYLSSVSGGGYLSSWLSLWRSRIPDAELLRQLNVALDNGAEPLEIVGLRRDSNYLTPQLGLLSADTWTVIALYLRNLLLNWMLFVPFFMGCFLVPHLCAAILAGAGDFVASDADGARATNLFNTARLSGAVLLILGLSCAIHGRFRRQGSWLTDSTFRLRALAPLIVSGALFTFAAVVAGRSNAGLTSQLTLAHGAVHGALIYFVAWAIGRFSAMAYTESGEKGIEWLDVFFWTLSGALVGTLAVLGMSAIAQAVASAGPWQSGALGLSGRDNAHYLTVVLGLSGLVLAYLAGELFYVGIASLSRKGDMDREWLARSSGWLSATAIAWALISVLTLYGPAVLRLEWSGLVNFEWPKIVAALAGGASGVITLVLGSSTVTAATRATQVVKSVPPMRLASVAAVIFAALLTALLSLFDAQLEGVLQRRFHGSPSVACDLLLLVALLVIALALSRVVNVNRFSMHALYRNRLVRAFLGSARAEVREPDPFTGFDPHDNPPLAEVVPKAPDRLFHVINTALNVVSSGNPAWQERKAESFTMSRLHCGNRYVGYRDTREYGGRDGGLSLGTAMAISGAAVSPNQGYNSSPLIGFLLMLFNVRLGWWLGNPGCRGTCHRDGPLYSLSPALRELAGDTSDDSRYIYLSDGGHFENLGLYEMVRRRCRLIVVSDAGCDPTFTFGDLGNAVRKIFIDSGVSIDFAKLEIKARQNPPLPGLRFAIGTIRYPGSARPGWLLYLKPTYQGTERADVRSYASGSKDFPHESTTDQWFSESQLESYRALGASVAEYICSGGKGVAPGTAPAAMGLAELQKVANQLLLDDLERFGRTASK